MNGAWADEARAEVATFAELLRRLSTHLALLVREEIQLARAESAKTFAALRAPLIAAGVAAVCGLAALGALTATLVAVLALVVPVWAAALITSGLYALVTAAAALRALSGLRRALAGPPLPRTLATLREDVTALGTGGRGQR